MADKTKKYESDSGNLVSFSTAYSRPDTKEYEAAKADLEKFETKLEVAQSIRDTKEQIAKKKRIKSLKEGFKKALADDPANFIDLLAKGGEGISKDDVIDLVTDMTLSKGFDDTIFGGLPSVNVPDDIAEKLKTERAKDKLDHGVGALSDAALIEKEDRRKAIERKYLTEGAAARREKVKAVIEGLQNPFSPKKRVRSQKLSELSNLSTLLLNEDSGTDMRLDQMLSDEELLEKAKEGFTKAGIPFHKDMDIEEAVGTLVKKLEKMGLDVSDTLKEDALLDTVDTSRAKLKALADMAKKEAEKIQDSVVEKAKSSLKGETKADRQRLEKNPSMRLLKELKQVNLTDDEKQEKAEARKFSKKRREFRDKITSLMTSKQFGGGATGEHFREKRGLDEALKLLNEIPEEFLGDVSDGYESASEKLTETFTDQNQTMSERLSKLSKQVDEIWKGDISQLSGAELGKAIAAVAMAKAFVSDPEYGVRPADDFMVTTTDSSGRQISAPDQQMMESNTADQVTRYKDSSEELRSEAFQSLHYKLSRTPKGSAEAHRIQSTIDGVVVAMLINNDSNIPSNRSKVDPFLLRHATTSPSQELYNAINISSKLDNGATPKQVREVQLDYLNTLNNNDFFETVGGSQGPFSEMEDVLQDNYCPDHPLNGELAGRKIAPGEVCPYPVAPVLKKLIRDHISRTLLDHYTVVPTSEDMRGGWEDDKKSKKDSNLAQFLKRNKKEYLSLLTHKNPEKREEALAFLLLKMRAANLQDLEFTGFKGKDLKTRNQAEVEKMKRDAILKLIKEADSESLKEVIEKVDEITNSTSKPSSSSMWGGSYDFDY